MHQCKQCPAAFPTGVALGGHMRKHLNRPLVVNRKKQKPPQDGSDLRLSLAPPGQGAAPAPAPEPVPAIAAAASPPAQAQPEQPKEEVAEHGAEPASETMPTPAPAPAPEPTPTNRRGRTVRIFGVDVEMPPLG
uniref:C2H2-type domain-containing protein n=1 Tax=Oryza brachyantha TaxID=4533 RepID=J3L6L5_ORYBR